MKERALLFGEAKSLVGVVAEPAASAPDRPGVLIFNAGVLHRVGPNRLHVRLARGLAEQGFASLRFDFSGLGDSRPRAHALPFAQAVVAEARQAMEVLAGRGARSFVLVGLCSGADNALRVAGHDERVVGTVLIEPYGVPARGFLLYRYRRKLLNPVSWWRLLRGRSELLQSLRVEKAAEPPPAPEEDAAPVEAPAAASEALVPSGAEVVQQLRTLAARGVEMCLVYSRESVAYYNYRTLLRREIRRAGGRARVEVVERTDHVFTPPAAQERLVAAVLNWARDVGSSNGKAGGARP